MVGLTGIVATQKGDIDLKKLSSLMCQKIKHHECHKTELYVNNGIGMGRVHLGIFNPEPQPIFNEDRSICIIMDGEIYDTQDIKTDLISRGHIFSIDNDPELILHLYEERGNAFVDKLNGCFSLAIWNEKLKKLIIANDRYGSRPIYYSNSNGYLLFGSEIKAILQDETFERKVDDRSVAEFFSFGHILGNKTFFLGIELLPPASIMAYDHGKVSIEQYWDFEFNKKYEDNTEDYYIEKSSKLLSQAVERRMKGNKRMGVMLSGGLDSRTIVASIQKKHYPIHTITHGEPGCNDVRFAHMIATKLGTIHHFFEFKPEDIIKYSENFVYLTDGMINIAHGQRMQTYSEAAEFSDVVLHGWLGDATTGALLQGFLIDFIKFEDNLTLFDRVCEKLPDNLIGNLFSDDYFPKTEKNLNLSKNYILRRGENIKLPENRLMYYDLKEYNRRIMISGFILIRNSLEFRIPFSDDDYIDFFSSIPPKFMHEQRFYKEMILKMFPDLKNVPYQGTGLPLYRSIFQIHIIKLSKQFSNHITRRLFNFQIFSNNNINIADYGEWIRNDKKLKEYILNILLDQKTVERPYFNQKVIKKILYLHMNRKKDYSNLIGLLITFELWNRKFIDE